MDNQNEMIIRYMIDTGSITPLDAVREFGIMRLSARIHDIKGMGYYINSSSIITTNRYGRRCRYSRYSFITNSDGVPMRRDSVGRAD